VSPVLEQSVQWFNERAAREPRTWEKVVLLFLAVATPVWLGSERGVVIGVVAAVVYGPLFGLGALRHRQMIAWSQAHPNLDMLWLPALLFLALAGWSDWPLWVCVAAALGGGAAIAAVAVALRRRRTLT
jgi:hypothetical protein